MAFERKMGESALFKNSRNDFSDFNGEVSLRCGCGREQSYWIDAWTRVAATSGVKYLALKFKRKEARTQAPTPTPAAADLDDF